VSLVPRAAGPRRDVRPTLDPFIVSNRLETPILSAPTRESVRGLPSLGDETERARGAVLAASGSARIHEWVKQQILAPGSQPFIPDARPGLTQARAEQVADFLTPAEREKGGLRGLGHCVFHTRITKTEVAAGSFVAVVIVLLGALLWRARLIFARPAAGGTRPDG
jgi:hypothetical protein